MFRALVSALYALFLPVFSCLKRWLASVAPEMEGCRSRSRSTTTTMLAEDHVRRLFSTFDMDGDGVITVAEMQESVRKMGLCIAPEDLLSADANGDGFVDVREFAKMYDSLSNPHHDDAHLAQAFTVFDQNGDGLITAQELQSVLSSLGLGPTDCSNIIRNVDLDGDGMVNYAEFKQMMAVTGT